MPKSAANHETTEDSILSKQDLFTLIKQAAVQGIVVNANTSKVDISHPWRLTVEHTELIKQIFSFFLQSNQTDLKLFISSYIIENEINENSFNATHADFKSISNLLDKSFLTNPVIFIGLLSALYENGLLNEIDKWCDFIKDKMKESLGAPLGVSNEAFYTNIRFLYDLTQNESVLEQLIPTLASLLVTPPLAADKDGADINQRILRELIREKKYRDIIKKADGNSHFLMHDVLRYNPDFAMVQLVLQLFDNQPPYSYNTRGDSLLHGCWYAKQHLQKAFELTPDINHRNADGNTALHMAALDGDFHKAIFLIAHGADPNIKNDKNETFWTITPNEPQVPYTLHTYRDYHQHGQVLYPPPLFAEQKGGTCGYYAVAGCAAHLFNANEDQVIGKQWQPKLFSQRPLPARKSDTTPPSSSSLREKRYESGNVSNGSILSVPQLVSVINQTECESKVFDIQDQQQFLDVIKMAIDRNLPIIIPFSSHDAIENLDIPEPTEYESIKAHWSTIVGYKTVNGKTTFLMAENEGYFEADAERLFNSFYNIKDYTGFYTSEKKKGANWQIHKTWQDIPFEDDVKFEYIPPNTLQNFRRKLIVVAPPKYNVDLLALNKKNANLSP